MSRPIISVWESPSNEGTARYMAGWAGKRSTEWDPAIHNYPILWTVGTIERMEYDEGFRIDVYDTEGVRRVSLPAQGVAWEYGDD